MVGDGGGSASGAEALQQPAEEDIAAWVSKMGLQIPESWDRVGMEKTAVENDAAVSAAYAKFAPESEVAEPTAELTPLEQSFKTVAENGGKFPGHSHNKDAKAFEKASRRQMAMDQALKEEYALCGKPYGKQRQLNGKRTSETRGSS